VPTDTATRSVDLDAAPDTVLATLRDVGSQPQWIPEIIEAQVLTTGPDGLPATARFAAAAPVGRDRYTLAYAHGERGLSWTLVEGRLQTGQEGVWTLDPLPGGRTRATYTLTIHHNLPLPGIVRRRVIAGLVASTVGGLATRTAGRRPA
jgi:hypothetical protein